MACHNETWPNEVSLCRFNQMYGVMGVLDRLHGTDEMFRKSKQHERHIVVLGLTPIKHIIPDQIKKDCCCN